MTSLVGFVLGLAGGVLDFASGTSLVQSGMPQSVMESATTASENQEVGVVLYALGALVIASAVVSVTTVGKGRPRLLSGLMVVYGAAMLLVGGSMAGGLLANMAGAPLYGYAMVVVGALMILNGSVMSRTRVMM